MTYDPDRDARAPADISPNSRPYERTGTGLSVALMVALMAAFVAVGFWLSASNDSAPVVTDQRPAAERSTTGSRETPLPNTPTPPTMPSPSRQ
jgi:hypothetical protein